MKKILLNVLCGLLCAALLIGAVCIGAVRGWQGEREKALSALSDELSIGLEERAMDAANLSVVVSRHLAVSDERLVRLQELRLLLSSGTADAYQLIQTDAELTELARSLGQELTELSSVQASPRDQAYISTLTRTLAENTGMSNAYEALVVEFNSRLIDSPTGWIARLFGVSLIGVQ